MTNAVARIAPSQEALLWSLRYLLSGLAIAGIAASLTVSTANAADALVPVPTLDRTSSSPSWGAGPVMVSLLAVARQERPIAGIEPAALRSGDVRPTSLPLPVRESATVVTAFAPERALHIGGSLKLTPVSFSLSSHR